MPSLAAAYRVLGVRPGAGPDEVRAAYRAGARREHPDAGGSATGFRTLRDAVETIAAAGYPPAPAPATRPRPASDGGETAWRPRPADGSSTTQRPPDRLDIFLERAERVAYQLGEALVIYLRVVCVVMLIPIAMAIVKLITEGVEHAPPVPAESSVTTAGSTLGPPPTAADPFPDRPPYSVPDPLSDLEPPYSVLDDPLPDLLPPYSVPDDPLSDPYPPYSVPGGPLSDPSPPYSVPGDPLSDP